MARDLKRGRAYVRPLAVSGDAITWLKGRAEAGDVLLAHQDDGVVWGKAHANADWVTSDVATNASPALCGDRLWTARLFNERREILLWRDEGGAWQARELSESGDGDPAFVEWFDEPQLLWGNHGEHKTISGVTFAVLQEGAEGLCHAPPIELPFDEKGSLGDRTRACLRVRHYLAQEDIARVAASRLAKLDIYRGEGKA